MRLSTIACEFGASGTLAGSGAFHGPVAANPLSGAGLTASARTVALDPCADRMIESAAAPLTIQRAERAGRRMAFGPFVSEFGSEDGSGARRRREWRVLNAASAATHTRRTGTLRRYEALCDASGRRRSGLGSGWSVAVRRARRGAGRPGTRSGRRRPGEGGGRLRPGGSRKITAG